MVITLIVRILIIVIITIIRPRWVPFKTSEIHAWKNPAESQSGRSLSGRSNFAKLMPLYRYMNKPNPTPPPRNVSMVATIRWPDHTRRV